MEKVVELIIDLMVKGVLTPLAMVDTVLLMRLNCGTP